MDHIKSAYQKQADWLIRSGIQNPISAQDMDGLDISGSFNAWYNPETDAYAYVYIEISGYAISSLCHLFKHLNDPIFLERAERIGTWLSKIQSPNGTFPTALYISESAPKKPKEVHSFDVGMVINGLACLYNETSDHTYLKAAQRAADWILSIQKEDGSIAATIDAETGAIKDCDTTWSTQSGPYHAKLAIGLLHLYRITSDERYKKSAERLCDYALTRQTPEGQFLTYGSLNGTNMHPHAYSAEGLYTAGVFLQKPEYLSAARRATEWSVRLQKDGITPRHVHDGKINYNARIDAHAQIIRLSNLMNIPYSDLAIDYLLAHQDHSNQIKACGGMRFGVSSTGEALPHINSWVTMFALQALTTKETGDLPLFYLV